MNPDFAPSRSTLVVATTVLALECAVLILGAVLYVALGLVGDTGVAQTWFGIAAMLGLAATGLGFLTRGLWRARRWALSPSITWQVLQGLVGAYLLSAGSWLIGGAVLALALIGLVPLLAIARYNASAGENLNGGRGAIDEDNATEW